jgi:hypothetical protein
VLFLIYGLGHLNTLVGPPAGALLMKRNLWIPMWIAVALILIRFLVLCALPETNRTTVTARDSSTSICPGQDDGDRQITNLGPSSAESSNADFDNWNGWRYILPKLLKLVSTRGLIFCFACFFFKRIAFSSESIVYQWASEVLHARLYATAWLRVLQAGGASIVTLVLFPALARIYAKYGLATSRTDMWSIRMSLTVAMIGFGVLWIGRRPVVMGLGMSHFRFVIF